MMGRQDLYIKFMQIYSLCYVRNASGIGVQGREKLTQQCKLTVRVC